MSRACAWADRSCDTFIRVVSISDLLTSLIYNYSRPQFRGFHCKNGLNGSSNLTGELYDGRSKDVASHTRRVTFRRHKLYDTRNKWVLSPLVNCSKVSFSFRRWQGREFHSVGRTMPNARGPYVDNLCRRTFRSVCTPIEDDFDKRQ